ncbi:hypothetical protein HXZ94_05615 [Empedobacter falsenii]|uniref:hypothetical protein n=1 Tax=Empedobacter falsenii TaxID=343874 RepID=UPI002576AB98|nr:hypothetical protein [Empedobacter falsenii]MDM1297973.1 hypothetical protein [Empedobacter falsenii]MDM1317952.1 hypothetical protein [Empedobacter falsenii]
MLDIPELRQELLNKESFNQVVIDHIYTQNWLNIWVPKQYNGLGLHFSEGLKVLQSVAKIDGSLGWFITLCSGANYFSRNLKPDVAYNLFSSQKACFGGSGMLGGTAEKVGDKYIINGLWHYATGAPYLTHFTLNAKIIEDGKELLDENGEPKFLSFILNKSQVKLISTWKSIGMVATSSHSFEVENKIVHQDYSFIYNQFYSDDLVEKIPFRIFADLTLLVNYLGMAEHFIEKSLEIIHYQKQTDFESFVKNSTSKTIEFAKIIENLLANNSPISEEIETEIHSFGIKTVEKNTQFIIEIYPQLGIKASKINEEINQIFRDYFTATQHRNFRQNIQLK